MSKNVKWRMQKAAYLLLEGVPSMEVAKQLKLRPETISRWRKHPVFIKEYERARTEMAEDMRGLLWALAKQVFVDVVQETSTFNPEKRYENALKFFKTIKIEQIFAPNAPISPPEQQKER